MSCVCACRYVLDEFGARIQHSDRPSCRLVPLLYMGDGCGYSVLFPIREIPEGAHLLNPDPAKKLNMDPDPEDL